MCVDRKIPGQELVKKQRLYMHEVDVGNNEGVRQQC